MGSPDTLSEHRTFLILMCPSIFPEKTSFHSWPPASSPIPSISGLEEDERLKTISHYWVLPGVLFYPGIPMLKTMSWCLGASRRVARQGRFKGLVLAGGKGRGPQWGGGRVGHRHPTGEGALCPGGQAPGG